MIDYYKQSKVLIWKSRVMREYQARFCERIAGEIPACLLDKNYTAVGFSKFHSIFFN